MSKESTFRIILKHNYFEKDKIIEVIARDEIIKLKVLQKPYKKWYRRFLQFITFGLYEAPYGYKVKLMKND